MPDKDISTAHPVPTSNGPKFIADKLAVLIAQLTIGNTVVGACAKAGIPHATFMNRLQSDSILLARCHKAIGEAEAELVAFAREHAQRDGRVALMLLERRFPDRWSKHRFDSKPPGQASTGLSAADVSNLIDARIATDRLHGASVVDAAEVPAMVGEPEDAEG